jgi:hypothetical protein
MKGTALSMDLQFSPLRARFAREGPGEGRPRAQTDAGGSGIIFIPPPEIGQHRSPAGGFVSAGGHRTAVSAD